MDDLAWAYADGPLPIGHGQTISQPYIVALMTELLQVEPTDRVLEVGTGSGYQAAILGQVAAEVHTVEVIPELAAQASRTLADLGYANIHVHTGDGSLGWPEAAPYDGDPGGCRSPLCTATAAGPVGRQRAVGHPGGGPWLPAPGGLDTDRSGIHSAGWTWQ